MKNKLSKKQKERHRARINSAKNEMRLRGDGIGMILVKEIDRLESKIIELEKLQGSILTELRLFRGRQ